MSPSFIKSSIERKTSLILGFRICIVVENQQQKLRRLSKLKLNLREYNYSVIYLLQKALKSPSNSSVRTWETKRNKQIKFYYLYLYLTQIMYPQERLVLGQIMFKDLRKSIL